MYQKKKINDKKNKYGIKTYYKEEFIKKIIKREINKEIICNNR